MDQNEELEYVFCSDPNIADLLPLYINGHVKVEERERIERHLATCRQCQEDIQLFLDLKRVGKEVFCQD